MRDQWPRSAFPGRAEHECGHFWVLLQVLAHDLDVLAHPHRDDRHLCALREQVAGGGRHQRFGARAGFFLDGGLDAAEGVERLRRNEGEKMQRPVGFGRAPRRELQGDKRLIGFIDDYQIDPHLLPLFPELIGPFECRCKPSGIRISVVKMLVWTL
ncbi:hypothetical protein SPHV1_210008 [Novosphingobium sp. KN65.2]|nr:hypothetical protein SPHV1_210008 [Novosphingobium sp. KN65.2]